MPGETPETVPDALIVAIVVGLLFHTPPGTGLLSVSVPPTQNGVLPVIGGAVPFTVITTVA